MLNRNPTLLRELQKNFQMLSNPKQSTYPATDPKETIDYITALKSNANGFRSYIPLRVLDEPWPPTIVLYSWVHS